MSLRISLIDESQHLAPAKRCPDFDSDCKDVIDHFKCWNGGILRAIGGIFYETEPADGYCPYLIGQERKP